MQADWISNMVITRVHSASTMYTPVNAKIRRRDRECWAIVLKYEGATVYRSGGREYFSDANHVVVLPRGCCYDWNCTAAGHFSIVEFQGLGSGEAPVVFRLNSGEKLLRMMRELEHKRNLKLPLAEPESIRDVYSMLLLLAKAEGYQPGEKMRKIQPAISYISQNYQEALTNDLLAGCTGLSTVYFRKLFTELMGVPPMTYVQQFRVEKAKEMLKSDYGTLSDMALSLGYPSLYDFSRAFKKHTGVAPSQYGK